MTTEAPAAPKRRSPMISDRALSASEASSHTNTPLPAANPSAFTTQGPSWSRTCRVAAAKSSKVSKRAVGTP
jgi:hypothetical protein